MGSKVDELSLIYKYEPSEENFKRLILEYRPKIRSNVELFIKMYRKPRWIVDDLSSEIELHIFKTIDKYFDPMIGEFESWAFALTKQYVIGAINKNMYAGREILVEDTTELDSFIGESNQRDAFLMDEIRRSLNTLDDLTRKCIILVFFEEKNYEEASKIVNICPSAICKRCKKGIKNLKLTMESWQG